MTLHFGVEGVMRGRTHSSPQQVLGSWAGVEGCGCGDAGGGDRYVECQGGRNGRVMCVVTLLRGVECSGRGVDARGVDRGVIQRHQILPLIQYGRQDGVVVSGPDPHDCRGACGVCGVACGVEVVLTRGLSQVEGGCWTGWSGGLASWWRYEWC